MLFRSHLALPAPDGSAETAPACAQLHPPLFGVPAVFAPDAAGVHASADMLPSIGAQYVRARWYARMLHAHAEYLLAVFLATHAMRADTAAVELFCADHVRVGPRMQFRQTGGVIDTAITRITGDAETVVNVQRHLKWVVENTPDTLAGLPDVDTVVPVADYYVNSSDFSTSPDEFVVIVRCKI